MAPEKRKGIDKSRGIKVQSMAYILAIYHLVVNIILFFEYSVQMDKKKNFSVDLSNFNNIASTVSSYLLLVVLFLISLSLLIGVKMNRGSLVIPFLAVQTMDFLLSCMIFFTSYSEIPSRQEALIESNKAVSKLDTQSTGWRYFQLCLGLMITCSCYVEFPTYLNLKTSNYLVKNAAVLLLSVLRMENNHQRSLWRWITIWMQPYFSVCMSSEKYIKKMIIFLVLHAAVILYKLQFLMIQIQNSSSLGSLQVAVHIIATELIQAFMICCIWRFFKGANAFVKNQTNDEHSLKEISKTTLPSYKEAVKIEFKDLPPPYAAA